MKKLEMKNVSKTFYTEIGALDVLEDITFNLNEGEIIAIVGPSGSGKSTLLNIISKLIEPTEGEIYVDGEIGYMFQRDHLFNWRTVWKNIMLGLEIKKEKNQEKSLKNRKNPVILSGNIEKWYILKMENTCKKKLFGV